MPKMVNHEGAKSAKACNKSSNALPIIKLMYIYKHNSYVYMF